MNAADRIRIQHMRDAAREAITFVEGRQRADLDRDRVLALALVRCIEIIGEAAAQVTGETRVSCPQIPWPSIVGMRNRLIHAYFDVDLDRVWDTLTTDLPPLIGALETLLSEDEQRDQTQ
ncbi:MAG TPA: HepT-like ribonuclease domain-containing protein [Phycisphaerae bacterium]|nr:HepT-like ribonuclease domain-containing protein [Phycisphaerae bacterium]